MSVPVPTPRPLGPGTLGRRLVLRVAALVAVTAVLLSFATTLAAYQMLLTSIDRQLVNTLPRRHTGPRDIGDQPRGNVELSGQPLAVSVQYQLTAAGTWVITDRRVLTGSGPQLLDSGVAAELAEIPANGHRVSKVVPGLGHYRVVAVQRSDPDQGTMLYVVGLPLAETDRFLTQLVILEALLTALAIAAAILIARQVVIRSLRPLNRVAATAREVSGLELSRGEVALPVRVAERDADPTNEVGQVGFALNHMLANIEGALAARQASETKVRQFVADASHELRNPLAAIRGYAEVTRPVRDQLPPDTAFALSRVESEAERMSRLVEDMLLLARLDSNPNLTLTEVDATEVVLNAVSDAQAAGSAYHWKMDLPDDPVTVIADRHRLHQVVANLLSNTRSHTPEGTTVTTSVRRSGDVVEISVHDNGPGIPPQIAESVFERFTRADTGRTRHGKTKDSTGLGLAIVAAVMEAHHGSAGVRSTPGDTTFTLRLPLNSSTTQHTPTTQHS